MDLVLLIAWAVWPPVSWLLWRKTHYRVIHWVFVLPFVTLVGFGFMFLSLVVSDALETQTLNKFDTDGSGGFDQSEMTPDAELALKNYTSDASRSLAWVLAIPITFGWVTIVYLMGLAFGSKQTRE